MDFDRFCQDQKTLYAVVRAIEIIGEAVKNIPNEIRAQYPKIPWSSVAKMRDRLAHQYFGINEKLFGMRFRTIYEKENSSPKIIAVLSNDRLVSKYFCHESIFMFVP